MLPTGDAHSVATLPTSAAFYFLANACVSDFIPPPLAFAAQAKSSTAHADINEYFLERLTKHLENVAQCRAAGSPPVAETATISLRRFVREARGGRKKLTAILTTAADVICAAGGARVVFCKSGKDRTAMAVTLEQARLLQRACQQVRFNGIAVAGKTDEAAHAAASFNLAALSLSSFPGLFWRPGAEGDNDEREDVIEAANLQREFGVRLRISNKVRATFHAHPRSSQLATASTY